jgi:ferredoxin
MASGICRRAAPEVFAADAAGWVALREPRPEGPAARAALDAAEACPTGAIEIDDEHGEPVWP